ncbi:Sec-independent protein translocase subunit TatA/TatB [Methanocella arvoryzae]|nr:twin-arginine translocase TatA/TatE family subunit [Methanocella arvoryzae]
MAMLGTQELLLIFLAIVLLFGATKLPELARSMGRSMGEFKRGQQDIERELQAEKSALVAQPGADIALTRTQGMAKKMGIDIVGKTDDQLLAEIEKKLEKK